MDWVTYSRTVSPCVYPTISVVSTMFGAVALRFRSPPLRVAGGRRPTADSRWPMAPLSLSLGPEGPCLGVSVCRYLVSCDLVSCRRARIFVLLCHVLSHARLCMPRRVSNVCVFICVCWIVVWGVALRLGACTQGGLVRIPPPHLRSSRERSPVR